MVQKKKKYSEYSLRDKINNKWGGVVKTPTREWKKWQKSNSLGVYE